MAVRHNALLTKDALPRCTDDITPAWCSKALGLPVTDATLIRVRHGASSIAIMELSYESGTTPGPKRVCVKGGFNPELIAVAPSLTATYRREAEFYHDIVPKINMRLAKTYYCATNAGDNGQGIVIMEDLTDGRNTFGTPLEPWPASRVMAGVEQLAMLHGATWGHGEKEYPWCE